VALCSTQEPRSSLSPQTGRAIVAATVGCVVMPRSPRLDGMVMSSPGRHRYGMRAVTSLWTLSTALTHHVDAT